MIKRLLLAAMVAASLGSVAVPAGAVLIMKAGPPPPRTEIVPEPRRGYVWVGGYWDWKNRHHQWVKGKWLRERHGYQYTQPAWVERDGRWHMERGNWRRGDRDGDGVPNGQDRRPDDSRRF